ncbi:MAG: phosphatidate cytidylyltransferase [Proteobacteria bacterium]|nr:phosphatidate cytidylyltransferase [Pseudomonadota bacterium]MDA1301370.1 phosphatidate cytidylyltransferase [Pseudomonadota bacterium]
MLGQRIITALIMAPIALAGVFLLQNSGFAVFVGAVLVIAAWEWARLAGIEGPGRVAYAAGLGMVLGASFYLPAVLILALGLLWWLLALALVVAYPGGSQIFSSRVTRCLLGLPLFVPGFMSLLQLKAAPDAEVLIVLLFFLIWGADVGAYFSGKAFGKRKLAPAVSPGKSWAGFYGGMATAIAIAVAIPMIAGLPMLVGAGGALFVAGCLFVAMTSVLGDLTISMFKRYAGVKDASNLLPGHGGVLDRIDSLLAAGPVFAVMILLMGYQT